MQERYPTPHINAKPGDFAKTVLMPGDPQRSKFIAENFLENAILVNDVRGIQGYTGEYKSKKVSVMASGMGIPSIAIYSYELYNIFGVENIIRIGSAGALREDIKVMDIVVAMGSCTNSNYSSNFALPGSFAPICSYKLLGNCSQCAEKLGVSLHVGNVLSSDIFYNDESEGNKLSEKWSKMGVLAVEMELAALYMNAARYGGNALAVCTISDNIVTGESTDAEQRRSSFTQMMRLALETAITL